jgi:hypothetical protein
MLSNNNQTAKLPEEFQKYFWDVRFDELSFEKFPRLIAERILNYGDLDSIKWLLSKTDKQFIRNIVETSRNLNAKTKNYWQLIFG